MNLLGSSDSRLERELHFVLYNLGGNVKSSFNTDELGCIEVCNQMSTAMPAAPCCCKWTFAITVCKFSQRSMPLFLRLAKVSSG